MQARDVLSSLTFRYIAQYIVALSAAVFMLLGAFYLYLSYNAVSELGVSVMEEGETLQLVYRGQDLEGVKQYIDDQAATPALQRFFYLVTDAAGEKIAGNLEEQPNYREFDEGWFGFEMALPQLGKPIDVDFLARPVDLGNGYNAIVATDYAELANIIELVFQALVRMMAITVILGMTGGFFVAQPGRAAEQGYLAHHSQRPRSSPQSRPQRGLYSHAGDRGKPDVGADGVAYAGCASRV